MCRDKKQNLISSYILFNNAYSFISLTLSLSLALLLSKVIIFLAFSLYKLWRMLTGDTAKHGSSHSSPSLALSENALAPTMVIIHSSSYHFSAFIYLLSRSKAFCFSAYTYKLGFLFFFCVVLIISNYLCIFVCVCCIDDRSKALS